MDNPPLLFSLSLVSRLLRSFSHAYLTTYSILSTPFFFSRFDKYVIGHPQPEHHRTNL